jgi:hypothetical protein
MPSAKRTIEVSERKDWVIDVSELMERPAVQLGLPTLADVRPPCGCRTAFSLIEDLPSAPRRVVSTKPVDWDSPLWGVASHNVHESSDGSWVPDSHAEAVQS